MLRELWYKRRLFDLSCSSIVLDSLQMPNVNPIYTCIGILLEIILDTCTRKLRYLYLLTV